MNGLLNIFYEKGKAKRKDLRYYPIWKIEVTDWKDKTKKASMTLSHTNIKTILKMAIKHKVWMDIVSKRKTEFTKWKIFYEEVVIETQKELTDYDIPKIYKECIGGKDES